MTGQRYLVCPSCEHAEPATEEAPCPACGSDRAYLHAEPALPDATTEAYVKLDADSAARGSGDSESRESAESRESPE